MTYDIVKEQSYERKLKKKFNAKDQERIKEKTEECLCRDPWTEIQQLEGKFGKQRIRKFRIGNIRVFLIIEEPHKKVHLIDVDFRGSAYDRYDR